MPSLVIHGHFYQPPRENPFLDEVETEPSAAPYHDWNQRIERECYRAVVAARVTGAGGRIARVVNTLERISFNFGPTLLEWLAREACDTYEAILAADRASAHRLGGHGNAIAQPYHHTILPLASRRDKVTEVRWGMADFRRRYGRDPEGMWLPETAVDEETLDVLAREGVAFTILAPHQVVAAPAAGRPGLYRTTSGRTIALCIYDGALSHGIAFGGLLHDASAWARRIVALGSEITEGQVARGTAPEATPDGEAAALPDAPPTPKPSSSLSAQRSGLSDHGAPALLSAATDGETYGHHHKFGEMALARVLEKMDALAWNVENFASFLARVPPTDAVELLSPTSWSCTHGIERWRSDCGCRLDGTDYPSQAWRAPLRGGLERLASELHAVFEREGQALFDDPWAARDAYGAVVGGRSDEIARFAVAHASRARTPDDVVRARELLEMERDALRMFTSCAWFFDDIGGIEPRQVLRYAARATSLAVDDDARLETLLTDELAAAKSNDPTLGNGRDIYKRDVKPALAAPVRLAAAAVAGERVGAHTPPRGGARVDVSGDHVRVTEPRTGRVHALRATIERASSTDVITKVEDARGRTITLNLADLPERQRYAIRSRLRRAILPRCLTPEEIELLIAGDATLGGLIRVALLRTVERLEYDHVAEVVQLVNDLLDLFGQFEAKIPFDAQTAFWRIWTAGSTERQRELQALLPRLGFTPAPPQ